MTWSAEFFASHRRSLAGKIDGGLVVLTAHHMMQRRSDMTYPFTQEADFWYMTGIDEADWLMIYDGARDYMWIVAPELSDTEKLFDGASDVDSVQHVSGANEVVAANDFELLLRSLARKRRAVYTSQPQSGINAERAIENPARRQLDAMLRRNFEAVINCRKEIAALRAIKSDSEVATIAKAVDISVEAFQAVRATLDECRYEYEIDATLGLHFRRANGTHAYDPIVAGAERACTLHYTRNDQPVRKNTSVLIDAGAEIDHYCADITRTYVRGTPTKRYRQLHGALQGAQRQIIDLIEPHMPITDYITQSDDIMRRMLVEVGLLDSIDDSRYREYFPHAVSHGLGIDVHDSLGGSRTFNSGMVLTVEPGIYVPNEKIGIRLEDNILITEAGHKNLSAKLSTDY